MKKVLIVAMLWLWVGVATAQQASDRNYLLYLPANYDETEALPLLMVLHGASGDGRFMMNMTEFNPIADEGRFMVLYPDSLGYTWDFGGGVNDPNGTIYADDINYLTGLVAQIAAEYLVDLDRVFVTGYSDGATMAYVLGCQSPDTFKGVAGVAAPLSVVVASQCTPQPVNMLLIHGSDDPILSWDGAVSGNQKVGYSAPETFYFWGQHNECELASRTAENLPDADPADQSIIYHFQYYECADGVDVEFYAVMGGGHTWAGHPLEGVPFDLGVTNMDINASQVIWDWFASLE